MRPDGDVEPPEDVPGPPVGQVGVPAQGGDADVSLRENITPKQVHCTFEIEGTFNL